MERRKLVKCPTCNGDGIIEREATALFGGLEPQCTTHDCPQCGGAGEVRAEYDGRKD